MHDIPGIRPAGPGEETRVSAIIALGFAADPFARWAAPDPATYLAMVPEVAQAFGGRGFAHGSVHLAEGGAGAAMWLPPGVEPDAELLGAIFERHVAPETLADLAAVFERMESAHPAEPHWYLPLIAVDPRLQGRGIGSALLRHALARCDADGIPAYLESSNPRNIGLYQRHGFEVRGPIQVGSSPEVVPMLRLPR